MRRKISVKKKEKRDAKMMTFHCGPQVALEPDFESPDMILIDVVSATTKARVLK